MKGYIFKKLHMFTFSLIQNGNVSDLVVSDIMPTFLLYSGLTMSFDLWKPEFLHWGDYPSLVT